MPPGSNARPRPVRAVARRAALYVLLAVLFGLVRLPIFLDAADDYDHEEAITGNLTRDLRAELVLPVPLYQYMPFAHGPLVVGRLMVPFYDFFGDSLLAMKMFAFVVSVFIFLVWVRVVRGAFGPRATWPFALLWIACPPYLLARSVRVYGNHYESLFFTGLILIALERVVRLGTRKRDALLLGLVSGIGSYFCFQSLLPAAIAAALLWRFVPADRRARRAGLAALGFAIGFAPSILINLFTGEFYRHLVTGAYHEYTSRVDKLVNLATEIVPASPNLDHGWANVAYVLVALTSWAALLVTTVRNSRDRRAEGLANPTPLAIALFPPLWVVVYVASSWDLQGTTPALARYLVVLVPFVLAAVASFASGKRRMLGWLPALLLLAIVAVDGSHTRMFAAGFRFMDGRNLMTRASEYRGSYYLFFLRNQLRLAILAESDEGTVRETLMRVDPHLRSFADELLGAWQVHRTAKTGVPLPFDDPRPLADRDALLLGMGREYADPLGDEDLVRAIDIGDGVPDSFWIGLGAGAASRLIERDEKVPFPASAPLALVSEGAGRCLHLYNHHMPMDVWNKWAGAGLDPRAYLRGYGAHLADWVIFTRRAVGDRYALAHYFGHRMAFDVPDPIPLLQEGFGVQLARRGYRLAPIDATDWVRVEYAGDQKPLPVAPGER